MQCNQHLLNPARRRLLQGVAASVALTLAGTARATDAYPSKPVTIIVPYAPDGQGDVFARILASADLDAARCSCSCRSSGSGGALDMAQRRYALTAFPSRPFSRRAAGGSAASASTR